MPPNFDYERRLWDLGLTHVAGIDEVGRGAFAGPVVVGIVGFSSELVVPPKVVIKDSKKCTQYQREKACAWIKQKSVFWGVSSTSARRINAKGITKATHTAARRAVKSINNQGINIDHLLCDAYEIPRVSGIPSDNQTAVVKGDNISLSIAAASILAKVYRDQLMVDLHATYENYRYHWHKNKGYGTVAHRDALKKHGPTIHHREQYVKNYIR